MDVHAASIEVVRMMDGAKPQPLQPFKPADALAWGQEQKADGRWQNGVANGDQRPRIDQAPSRKGAFPGRLPWPF